MKPHPEHRSAVALTITCAVALLLLSVMAAFKLPDCTDFTVFGVQDIDGDGAKAWYTATKSINSVFLNDSDIY